ncbi:MAG: DUF5060 domain-containing protein [Kiritimatiellae bacterium]|nr:DUF5060 domain-containing protein [Kiritimatiellia bacterium]
MAEKWGIYEIELAGPSEGNPFTDIQVSGRFRLGDKRVEAGGFYDGDGVYRIRFMPDETGEWRYETFSNCDALNGKTGTFSCGEPTADNHGPVGVHNAHHFAYADGTPHICVGTTCYAWIHQGEALEAQTLATLESAPFNKIRMCVFPKHYLFNENEPELYPFEGEPVTDWDFARFNPAFFQHLELRVGQLRELGIEADIILFHPYDHWGFAGMSAEQDDRYLRYVIARLAAYRNVWWSLANEYDYMGTKQLSDWGRFFEVIARNDPYDHLRSIHNGSKFYDHTKPLVTHASIQSPCVDKGREWRDAYKKPVIDDELCYEGNIEPPWGNITPREMVHRFWTATVMGCYASHGETYMHPDDILWWAKGGVLHGESTPRIAFLRQILEASGIDGLDPIKNENWMWNNRVAGKQGEYYLFYFEPHQPSVWTLPKGGPWRVDVVDVWNMTITPVDGEQQGEASISLPGKPFHALRARKV